MNILNALLDLLQLFFFGAPLLAGQVSHEVELHCGHVHLEEKRLKRSLTSLVTSNQIETLRLAQLLQLSLQIVADFLDVSGALGEIHRAHLKLGTKLRYIICEPAGQRKDIPNVV